MMSALECRQQALHCEALAGLAVDEINRRMLLMMIAQWHKLAASAEGHAARIARSDGVSSEEQPQCLTD